MKLLLQYAARQPGETKLAELETRVVLDVQKYRFICEIMMVGKDHDVKVTQESDQSMQDAVNAAIDHAKRQASKNRDRITDHRRTDTGLPEPLDTAGR